jgi:hypothetical protein
MQSDMPIDKFIHKYEQPAVEWQPRENSAHSAEQVRGTWEIFSQGELTIQPKSVRTLNLGIGVQLIRRVAIASLKQSLKEKRCSLQDGFVGESVNDI